MQGLFTLTQTAILNPNHKTCRCVLAAVLHSDVPFGAILLNEVQRINSKVCCGENEVWTAYHGEKYCYDAREGAIGDTKLRDKILPTLSSVKFEIRPRLVSTKDFMSERDVACVQAGLLIAKLSSAFCTCIVSLDEIIVVTLTPEEDGVDHTLSIVCRIIEMQEQDEDDEAEELLGCLHKLDQFHI